MPRPLLSLGAALLLAWAATAVPLPCTSSKSTGIARCAECIGKTCYWCSPANSEALFDAKGGVVRCAATYRGAKCKTRSKDRRCRRCSIEDNQCAYCKPGYDFAANGKCVPAKCQATSQNPQCKSCNKDGTCSLCNSANAVVVPDNAQWINRGYPASKCLSKPKANALSKQIGLTPAILPAGCVETDAFFRCSACMTGTWLNSQRQCVATSSKCRARPYGQYCQKCDEASGKCTQCVEGRSPDAAGQCSLNCQGLYSFFCSRCSTVGCVRLFADKVYGYFQ